MTNQEIFANCLTIISANQQKQADEITHKLLREVIDRLDVIGDSLWQMNREKNQYRPVGNHKRKKRLVRRRSASGRKHAKRS